MWGGFWGGRWLAIGPGEALGAWLGGRIYDATGGYLPAFGFVVLALAAGVVAIWRVRVSPQDSRAHGTPDTSIR